MLGLDGAGKSSLLRIMAGEDARFDGEAQALAGFKRNVPPFHGGD